MSDFEFDGGTECVSLRRPDQPLAVANQKPTIAIGAGGVNALARLDDAVTVEVGRVGQKVAIEIAGDEAPAQLQSSMIRKSLGDREPEVDVPALGIERVEVIATIGPDR